MHFLFGDHFINSRNLFSWLCIGVVRRKFMLVTIGPGGVLLYKRLMGVCRWMGSHFHDWSDYNGVAFSIELLEWGRKFSDFGGK